MKVRYPHSHRHLGMMAHVGHGFAEMVYDDQSKHAIWTRQCDEWWGDSLSVHLCHVRLSLGLWILLKNATSTHQFSHIHSALECLRMHTKLISLLHRLAIYQAQPRLVLLSSVQESHLDVEGSCSAHVHLV